MTMSIWRYRLAEAMHHWPVFVLFAALLAGFIWWYARPDRFDSELRATCQQLYAHAANAADSQVVDKIHPTRLQRSRVSTQRINCGALRDRRETASGS